MGDIIEMAALNRHGEEVEEDGIEDAPPAQSGEVVEMCPDGWDCRAAILDLVPLPVAEIEATYDPGCAPLTVEFEAGTTGHPDRYLWEFGDNATSDQESPSHEYTAPGWYSVTLTVGNLSGQVGDDTVIEPDLVQVVSVPVAAFGASPVSGNAPLYVGFYDSSTGAPSEWAWDFGDSATSAAQSPSHVYQDAGTYDVSLTVSRSGCASDTESKPGYIVVTAPATCAYAVTQHLVMPVGQGRLYQRLGTNLVGDFDAWVEFTPISANEYWANGGMYLGTLAGTRWFLDFNVNEYSDGAWTGSFSLVPCVGDVPVGGGTSSQTMSGPGIYMRLVRISGLVTAYYKMDTSDEWAEIDTISDAAFIEEIGGSISGYAFAAGWQPTADIEWHWTDGCPDE